MIKYDVIAGFYYVDMTGTGHVCRKSRAESGGSRIEQKSDQAQRAQRKLKNQQYPMARDPSSAWVLFI